MYEIQKAKQMWHHSLGNIWKGYFNFSFASVQCTQRTQCTMYMSLTYIRSMTAWQMWALDNLGGKATLDNSGRAIGAIGES